MNSVLITILSLSASCSVVALLLLMMKPLVKRTVSKAFSYYIWLFVLLRLSVPLAAPVNVMDTLFHTEVSDATSVDQQGSPEVSAQAVTDPDPAAAQTASPATQTPQGSQRSFLCGRASAVALSGFGWPVPLRRLVGSRYPTPFFLGVYGAPSCRRTEMISPCSGR